jgi:hypothetical protein
MCHTILNVNEFSNGIFNYGGATLICIFNDTGEIAESVQ